MKLSALQVRKAQPREKPYKLTDGRGMYLLVNKSGKYWRFDYRFDGRRQTLALGVYPEVGLADARTALTRARSLLAQKINPVQAKKSQSRVCNTFRHWSLLWLAHWGRSKNEKHRSNNARRLELYVFPKIGNKPLGELTAMDFVAIAKATADGGSKSETASRVLTVCNMICRYIVTNGGMSHNLCADIVASDIIPPRKAQNLARIPLSELPQLLRDIQNYPQLVTRNAMLIMAHTFVRTSELIQARWSEFDIAARRWDIPAERMKMRQHHVVPLSPQVVALLEELRAFEKEGFVFRGHSKKKPHMSNLTILKALERMGYKGRMTGHGFRGVASTALHEMGFEHAHIELQLAHQQRNQISAAYNHAQYLEQRAEMMRHWSDHLSSLTPAKQP